MLMLTPLTCAESLSADADDGSISVPDSVMMDRTTSRSRQFSIYSHDQKTRAVLATAAEDLKARWQNMLHLGSDWQLPIYLFVHQENGSWTPGIRIFRGPGGHYLRLDFAVGPGFSPDGFAHDIIQLLYYELACRNGGQTSFGEPDKGSMTLFELPSWLIMGSMTHIRQTQADLPLETLQHLIGSGQLLTLEEFLEQDVTRFDAAAARVYQVYSYAFLRMLKALPQGADGLARLVRNLTREEKIDVAVLGRYFPALPQDSARLEKWWTLNLARLSSLSGFKLLTEEQTYHQLDATISQISFIDQEEKVELIYHLRAWQEIIEEKDYKARLAATLEHLYQLSSICHPLFSPLINDYCLLLQELITEKKRKLRRRAEEIDERLRRFDVIAKALMQRGDKMEDYLNWFEATQLEEFSGAFREYMEVARTPVETHELRDDPITQYMNEYEAEAGPSPPAGTSARPADLLSPLEPLSSSMEDS